MFDFTGKVVLVTGAGRGIGRAIALAFARQGAYLAVNDLTPINLDRTIKLIEQAGGKARAYVFDIAKKMPVEEMVDEVLQDWGRIDILVNNAGVHPRAALLDMDEWDLRRMMDVNLCGAFFAMQLAGRAMRNQGGGCIVNIAAAPVSSPEWKASSAFMASKAGLVGLTLQAAIELAGDNIRVNALCPGLVETEGLHAGAGELIAEFSKNNPSKRLPQPEEAADLVLYLCGQAEGTLTGQVINIG